MLRREFDSDDDSEASNDLDPLLSVQTGWQLLRHQSSASLLSMEKPKRLLHPYLTESDAPEDSMIQYLPLSRINTAVDIVKSLKKFQDSLPHYKQ